MSSLLSSLTNSLLLPPNPNPNPNFPLRPHSLPFPLRRRRLPLTAAVADEWGESAAPEPPAVSTPDPVTNDDEWGTDSKPQSPTIADEWGEISTPEPEATMSADPVKEDDEWGNGSQPPPLPPSQEAAGVEEGDRLGDLKRLLVDTLYGTDLGLRTTGEVRGEILELVSQLEAENPTERPVDSALLDGNWILLYTASSELLPLIAAGSTPLLKLEKITQEINSRTSAIVNATVLSSPLATLSFSATASFEVRSPSRIQVQFEEGAFQPPKISSSVNLPSNIDVFGQKIDLSPVQQSLGPVQEMVANIAKTISGQPPLKVAIPGNRAPPSWLLITYLDEDFRISRGDGGLFVLAKEGSPLLEQL